MVAALKPEKTLPHDQKKPSSDCLRLVVARAGANGRNRRKGAIRRYSTMAGPRPWWIEVLAAARQQVDEADA
jgi:hypothetical protein